MKVGKYGSSIYMGDSLLLKQKMDAKEEAVLNKGIYKKQAMHGVTSVNRAEMRMDGSMEQLRERVRVLQAENSEADAALQQVNRKMEQATADYEIEEDSQEAKDLELLKKEFDIKHHRIPDRLTEEEEKRLKEMERTDYHKLSMDLYEQADFWKEKLKDNKKEMYIAGFVLRSTRLKRLESQAMAEAQEAKEQMLEAASKEAAGILKDEAVQAIDERSESIKEAAETKKEDREEKEGQIEAAKEKKEEAEARTDTTREKASALAGDALPSEKTVRQLDAEIKKVIEEQKLLEEELKGMRVNIGI